jgi:hypothetical protein
MERCVILKQMYSDKENNQIQSRNPMIKRKTEGEFYLAVATPV